MDKPTEATTDSKPSQADQSQPGVSPLSRSHPLVSGSNLASKTSAEEGLAREAYRKLPFWERSGTYDRFTVAWALLLIVGILPFVPAAISLPFSLINMLVVLLPLPYVNTRPVSPPKFEGGTQELIIWDGTKRWEWTLMTFAKFILSTLILLSDLHAAGLMGPQVAP